jgi:hypothetical protein
MVSSKNDSPDRDFVDNHAGFDLKQNTCLPTSVGLSGKIRRRVWKKPYRELL